MDRRQSDDYLERLHKLAELRDRGVLSEEEFLKTKTRLLDEHPAAGMKGRGPAEQTFFRKNWLIVAGVGLLFLLIAGLFVMGRISSGGDDAGVNMAIGNDMAGVADPKAAEALCGAEATYRQISDSVFNKAIEQYEGDPAPLTSLRKSTAVRVQYPLLRGGDQAAERTDCSGHIILDLPPNVRAAFDGAKTLEADVDFSVQPAADGSGNVVTAVGTERLVERLVAAAGLVQSARETQQQAKSYNPSFDCAAAATSVEHMICQDEALSSLDRGLARRYAELKAQLSPDDWQQVADLQRNFLDKRGQCADITCVKDAYIAQSRYLDQLAPAQSSSAPQ